MTVISDDSKKSKKVYSDILHENEEGSQDSTSNDNNNNDIIIAQSVVDPDLVDQEDEFKIPSDVMKRLIDMVNKPRWVVPVLPGGDVEQMLFVSIKHAYHKKDEDSELFKDLYKNGLLISFEKILTDEAILNWKCEILDSIYRNCIIMLKLCALKIEDDNLQILEILALILNPEVKYHTYSNNFTPQTQGRIDKLEDFVELLRRYEVEFDQKSLTVSPSQKHLEEIEKKEIDKEEADEEIEEQIEVQNNDDEDQEVVIDHTLVNESNGEITESLQDSKNNTDVVTNPNLLVGQINSLILSDSSSVIFANNSQTLQQQAPLPSSSFPLELPLETEYKFCKPLDNSRFKLIYADLINCFGHFHGFDNILKRINAIQQPDQTDIIGNLTILLALLKPISNCVNHLTEYAINQYVIPIADMVVKWILSINIDVIKPDIIKEWKSDRFSSIIQYLENIIRYTSRDDTPINQLTVFRLNIILKVLQHASFNGRMNALNELNKLIKSISAPSQPNDRLTHVCQWIKDNEVLSIVLKENLHQPQYVEKVEKLISFMVKNNCLSNDDLDRLWDSQIGKHEAIVTNIHDLLAKLAYDFNPTQLQHLFDCFQKSWAKAPKRQRERLIDLIRRLAEEDKDGRMAKTALTLLWDLATQNECPLDIMESALRAHAKILDFCSNQDRETYRNEWLSQLINYLSDNEKNSVSTLRQIKEIIKLFQLQQIPYNSTTPRSRVIERLDRDHQLLNLITNNLVDYVTNFRAQYICNYNVFSNTTSATILDVDNNQNNQPQQQQPNTTIDFRFSHDVQIDERLDFLKFLLNESDGSLQIDGELLTKIWNCLVLQQHQSNTNNQLLLQQYINNDRDQCFKWLACLMDFDNRPFQLDIIEEFFQNHFLKLDPKLLTINGILLFELLFRVINQRHKNITENTTGVGTCTTTAGASTINSNVAIATGDNTISTCANSTTSVSTITTSTATTTSTMSQYLVIDRELIGLDYLWRSAMFCVNQEVFCRILQLLKSIFTQLGGNLAANRSSVHLDFIQHCIEILKSAFDTAQCLLSQLQNQQQQNTTIISSNVIQSIGYAQDVSPDMQESIIKLSNILQILCEFIKECDNRFIQERQNPALGRMAFGQNQTITVSYNNSFNRNSSLRSIEFHCHSNEYIGNLREKINHHLRETLRADFQYDLIIAGTDILLEERDNFKTLEQMDITNGSVLQMRIISNFQARQGAVTTNVLCHSSVDTDSTSGNNTSAVDIEKECNLPGVQIAQSHDYMNLLCNIGDLALRLNSDKLRCSINLILNLIPPDESFKMQLIQFIKQYNNDKLTNLLYHQSPMRTIYSINVLYSLLLPCNQSDSVELSLELLCCLVENNALHIFLTMLYMDNSNCLNVFVPGMSSEQGITVSSSTSSSQQHCTIRLLGLIRLMKITYLLLAIQLNYLLEYHRDKLMEVAQSAGTVANDCNNHLLELFSVDDHTHYFTVSNSQLFHKYHKAKVNGHLNALNSSPDSVMRMISSLPTRKDIDSMMKLCWSCSLGNRLDMMSLDIRQFHDCYNQITNMERSKSLTTFSLTSSNPVVAATTTNNNNNNNATTTSIGNTAVLTTSTTLNTSTSISSGLTSSIEHQSQQHQQPSMLSACTSPIFGMNKAGNYMQQTNDLVRTNQPTLCALECLSLMIAASVDTNIQQLIQEKYTKEFISVLLLHSRSNHIRQKSAHEIRYILHFSNNSKAFEIVIQMLFTKLYNVTDSPSKYRNVFELVVLLLSDLHNLNTQLTNTESILKIQLDKLLETKSLPDNASNQIRSNHSVLLIGRLNIIKELLRFFSPAQKQEFNRAYNIIDRLLDQFLFPSSKRHSDIKQYQQDQLSASSSSSPFTTTGSTSCNRPYSPSIDNHSNVMGPVNINNNTNSCHNYSNHREFPSWATAPLLNPICNFPESQKAAFDLLKVLVAGSDENMVLLCKKLDRFFYAGDISKFYLSEWDYKPSMITRSTTGYVGLKNAGATCYMNSILQQLFMITPIRNFILGVDAGPPLSRDDFDDNILYNVRRETVKKNTDSKVVKLDILREVQMIFGNLAFSKNQFFVPTGFWRHFKFWGDEVNLREQHDALEFFTCLVDTLDEALHSIELPKLFEEILAGQFADQKICKGCPHRYEKEENFFHLSVDIRNHENLTESLEQYVKGDLLEGDNAYFCESCKMKRDTVKRTCIKKLPMVLAIQLKRFDYDWEREIAVKFNDYFEFPNELDMAPYTVAGTSRRDHLNSINELVHCPPSTSEESVDNDGEPMEPEVEYEQSQESNCTRYVLKGVVVHGGQASGGHYYSFIRERNKCDNTNNGNSGSGGNASCNNNSSPNQSHDKMTSSDHHHRHRSSSSTNMSANVSGNSNSSGSENNHHSTTTGGSSGGNNCAGGGGSGNVSAPCDAANDSYANNTMDMNAEEPTSYSWYRFDDTDVTEVKMDTEEIKSQWFGGEFVGESYDHLVKRVSMRRQKRWWSAYILLYEREDFHNKMTLFSDELQKKLTEHIVATTTTPNQKSSPSTIDFVTSSGTMLPPRLPRHIEQNITLQNIEYSHNKTQYTHEYFSFLRELPLLVDPPKYYLPVVSVVQTSNKPTLDNSITTPADTKIMKKFLASILSKFLFTIGFKTTKSIRGPASEWINSLTYILQDHEEARLEFCINSVFWPLSKVTEYLFDTPNAEIRHEYTNLLRLICHWSLRDTSHQGYFYPQWQSDNRLKEIHQFIKERYHNAANKQLRLAHILVSIIHVLLNKDINEHAANSNEYLSFFLDYPSMGYAELVHCLDINLATHILKFCLDEYYPTSSAGNTSNNMSNSTSGNNNRLDISKLLCSFCRLMRCYDLDNITTDLLIDMCIPLLNQIPSNYSTQPRNIPSANAIEHDQHIQLAYFIDPVTPCYKIRKIPDHLQKYLFQKTPKFIKKIIEEFYNDITKDDFNKFLKYLCFNNYQCSIPIVDNLANDLQYAFIRNIKWFMELFRAVLDINDNQRIKRAITMIEGEHLDFVCRCKSSNERRSYFIMKMVTFALSMLNDDELRQMWLDINNFQYIQDKFEKALAYMSNVLHQNQQQQQHQLSTIFTSNIINNPNISASRPCTSPTYSRGPNSTGYVNAYGSSTGVGINEVGVSINSSVSIMDSNEDTSGNNIERTASSENMERIGAHVLKLFQEVYPTETFEEVELSNVTGEDEEPSQDPSLDSQAVSTTDHKTQQQNLSGDNTNNQ